MKIEGLVIGEETFDLPKCTHYLRKIKGKDWRECRDLELKELQFLVNRIDLDIKSAQKAIAQSNKMHTNPHQSQIDRIKDNILKMITVAFMDEG